MSLKIINVSICSILALLIALSIYQTELFDSEFNYYNPNLFEGLIILLFSYLVIINILSFYNNSLLRLWFRRIATWHLPISFLFILDSGGSNIIDPGEIITATFFAVLGLVITIILVLFQKFRRRH